MPGTHRLRGDHASVDDEHLSGDVARVVRDKERDRVRDILHRSEALERDLFQQLVLHLWRERLGEVVGTNPGATALQVMFRLAISRATLLVSPMMPGFAAA